jgi:hypothetical protein
MSDGATSNRVARQVPARIAVTPPDTDQKLGTKALPRRFDVAAREAVRRLRVHAGENQRYFASMLGISFSAFQKYETGRSYVPDSRLLVAFLARAIDQSRSDLAAVFKRELIAVLSPPRGFRVEVTVKAIKGKWS